MSTPALVIVQNGITALTYRGSIKLEIQAVGRVSVSRFGLAEGDVQFKAPTSLVTALAPPFGQVHPILSYLNIETIAIDYEKAYSTITAHYAGAYPGAISVYDYQPNTSSSPVETNPNFGTSASPGAILAAAGSSFYSFDSNGNFLGFLPGAGDNLTKFTEYLVSKGFYVESSVSSSAPDCSDDLTITTPDGSPPSTTGNWLKMPTFFQQRALVYDIRRSWQNSGLIPNPTSVY